MLVRTKMKMTNVSNIAKISVEKHESKEQFLYDLDKNMPLCELVKDICKRSGLPVSTVYGLKLIQIKNDPVNPVIDSYVSEKNLKNIQHNDCLKIVFSIDYLLRDRIIPHIDETGSLEREICYEALNKLCYDPVFIEELVESENHHKLIKTFVNDEELKENELKALLATICHLFQKGFITDTSHNFLQKTIKIIKKDVDNDSRDHVKYALAILHKILIQKDPTFLKWKIIKEVPITCITPYFLNRSAVGKRLQYGALLLINTIIRLCKGDQKKQLIKEMNLAKNRENIYKYIIEPGELDKDMQHELYVIQTYLLSLYDEAMKSEVSLTDNNVFKREEFELEESDIKRVTVLMDFDEVDISNKSSTVETMLAYSQPERWSLASLMSDKSQSSRKSSFAYSSKSRNASIYLDYEMSSISYLTLEALRHFKSTHKKNFYQSQIEEKVYEPGIFVTSERVVKMLAKLLDIGLDPPDSKSVFYQPIVFNTSPRQPFFLELFSRTMWLLSKTRREMKVSTIEDYSKVMNVLQKQVKIVLTKRPMTIKILTDEIKEINFTTVSEHWQKEKEEELKYFLENNQSIQELREKFNDKNESYVVENRKNIIKKGDFFPNVYEKKTSGSMFVELSKNEKELLLYHVIDEKTQSKELREKVKLAEITHVATGLNCKHIHLCKSPLLAFSILINYTEKQWHFIAKDECTACYWIDAFHILTGNPKRSNRYKKELEELVEMDLRLKIIELQNISIPKNPPPLPPLPKPLVPPKPPALSEHLKKKMAR
ncbi:engulfment and cell motility protein 2 [Leptinotarsa decemlineata]|uniref:engulfment and cell motility protein 2 n=1 Tax=Leptinotarsa decemlineata TaxID=7539 RepID=UPI003D30C0B3